MKLFDRPNFTLLERSMNAASLRQMVISNNIANAETPNFKRSEVVFEKLLHKEMQGKYIPMVRTHHQHLPIRRTGNDVEPKVVLDKANMTMNNNGNNVDIDTEMALLAHNQLHYNLLAQQTTHEFQLLRTAIGGSN